MSIGILTKEEFIATLQHYLSASGPIQSAELLRGRKRQLETVEEAFASPGRNVFIYGDRGVGKTSLAQTAAHQHQSSDRDPIIVACDASTTFSNMVQSIANKILANPLGSNMRSTTKLKAGVPSVVSAEREMTSDRGGNTPLVTDINSAVLLLKHLSDGRRDKTVVVVDEFDLIRNEDDKVSIANLLKQVGDQKIDIQFIFCGIGKSLDTLLGAHGSAHRYIQEVKLEPLVYGPRLEIIEASASAFGVDIETRIKTRIAAVSDGFPHYVHLVCEKLYWEMFRDPQPCPAVTLEHYRNAIRSAIEAAQQRHRKAYEKATMKEAGDYEEILWAAANHSDLFQNNDVIYASYQKIMEMRGKQPVERAKFTPKLSSLKSPSCGRILTSPRRNWTEFQENMIRGYVRLRAEDQGIELAQECVPSKETSEVWMSKMESKTPRSTFRSKIPPGVFIRRKR